MNSKMIGLTALLSTLTMASLSYADVPNTFASGEPAVASEINENFSGLDTRVTALENAAENSSATTISVDCASESINNTIAAAAPANHLIVNIIGTCNERVVISRSNVSLVGAVGGGTSINFVETPLSPLHASLNANELVNVQGTVNIIGALNVIIDNLTITGATYDGGTDGEAGKGVAVRFNSSVLIQNSTITGNNSGIISNSGGVAILSSNTITGNNKYGIIASDGGIIRLIGGNTIDQSTATSTAAVGAYRNGTITFLGANSVTSSNAALDIFHGSQVRAFYGLLTVNGNSGVGYESQINLRDANHIGNIRIYTKGAVRLQSRTNQTTDSITVTGDIILGDFAVFNASGATTVNGSVTCNSLLSSVYSSGTVTNGIIGCNQLLNLVSAQQ